MPTRQGTFLASTAKGSDQRDQDAFRNRDCVDSARGTGASCLVVSPWLAYLPPIQPAHL